VKPEKREASGLKCTDLNANSSGMECSNHFEPIGEDINDEGNCD